MCNCGKTRERWIVTLPGGMKITKSSEQSAKEFANRHPGATYTKAS